MKRRVLYSEDKIRGLLFGTFIGDAAGAGFEGLEPVQIPPLDYQYFISHPPRMYTDDTQMAISVFEEMVENGTIDQKSLRDRFLHRFSPWRGYSGGMLEVFEMWRDGVGVSEAASSLYDGSGSFGDGAAMRVAPVSAFYKLDETAELIDQVRKSSTLTHTHPYGISGAILQAYAVLLALNDIDPKSWIKRFFELPIESAFKIKLENISRCLERRDSPHESARMLGNGADALEAVSVAIYAFLRSPGFTDTLLFAVAMGGDTDTICAMAGAIAGAYYGFSSIPVEWSDSLENEKDGRDFINLLINRSMG